MSQQNNMRFVKHNDIDLLKWDRAIASSINGRIFGYSWYLNSVFQGWNAIVSGDYEFVMPLPSHGKIIRILKVPDFTNQMGFFSRSQITLKKFENLLNFVRKNHKFGNIETDFLAKTSIPGYRMTEKIVYQIDLILPYKALRINYSSQVLKTVISAKNISNSYSFGILPADVLDFIYVNNSHITKQNLKAFKLLLTNLLRKNLMITVGAYNKYNQLTACAVYVKGHSEMNLIYAGYDSQNDSIMSLTGIFDFFIKKYSKRGLTLIIPDNKYISLKKDIIEGFACCEKKYMNYSLKMFGL